MGCITYTLTSFLAHSLSLSSPYHRPTPRVFSLSLSLTHTHTPSGLLTRSTRSARVPRQHRQWPRRVHDPRHTQRVRSHHLSFTTCRSPPVVHTTYVCVGMFGSDAHIPPPSPHGSPQCGSLQWVGSPWFAVGVVAVGGSPRRWTAVRPWSPQAVRHPESPPPPPPPPRAREGLRCAILVQPLHPAGHRFPPTVHIHTQSTPVGTINVAPYHPSSWPSVCVDAPSLLTRPHVTTSRHPSLPPHPIPPHSSFPHPRSPLTSHLSPSLLVV